MPEQPDTEQEIVIGRSPTGAGTAAGPEGPPAEGGTGVMRAAGILAVGNVASRVLGLVREMVKANLFGASGLLSAYETAVLVPNSLFELIIGGMVNSALVPVFSDYAGKARREELWGLVSSFLSLATVVLLALVALVEVFTPEVAWLVGAVNFTDVTLTDISIRLMRLAAPAVLFLGLSSVLTGVLFALRRFSLPALTGAILNGTVVAAALLRPEEIDSLVWGLLIGSVLQIALQLPALRGAAIRPRARWRHPAIRRILWLYLPIVASIAINQLVVALSYNLANRTGDESLTYMRYATTLIQFPLGLVVTALSIATLPTLSRQASGQLAVFKRTLAEGIRLVLALILPATTGLFALAPAIIMLLFEHGQFLPADTARTTQVLRVYLFGLPFAAIDQMLVFASYARKDTWRPALVGAVSILVYSAVALLLLERLGLLSLMVADAVKHFTHTVLMLLVLRPHIGGLGGHGILGTVGRAGLAAGGMGLVVWGAGDAAGRFLPAGGWPVQLLTVAGAAGLGLAAYAGLARAVRLPELRTLLQLWPRRQ